VNVDLENLRIDHQPEAHGRAGVSPAWRVLFFLLLITSGAGGWYLWKDRPTGIEVEGQAVLPAPIPEEVSAPRTSRGGFTASGWVKLPLEYPVRVTPLVAGRLEEISVVEGDHVRSGELVARLYETDLRAALEAAEAKVAEAQATADKLKKGSRPQEIAAGVADVQQVEAELATANEILEHSRALQPSGAISLEELQRDESKVQVLSAKLARATEGLALLEEGFRSEEIDLAQASLRRTRADLEIARLRLQYTKIESPIDGVVIERAAEVGQWITPGRDSIVQLYDPADLEVRVDVNQDDLARVTIGQRVEISSRAQPGETHPGHVVRIEPLADEVKNTVPVRVKIEDPQGRLLYPDMVVKARFLDPLPERGDGEEIAEPPATINGDRDHRKE
jgi:HlyD family secretion protein